MMMVEIKSFTFFSFFNKFKKDFFAFFIRKKINGANERAFTLKQSSELDLHGVEWLNFERPDSQLSWRRQFQIKSKLEAFVQVRILK
jgi:hypothetical protein